MSRRRILTEAARMLLASFLGWAAGALVVWQFGRGSLADDIGLVVLAAVPWVAIPLAILRVVHHRARAPKRARPRTWGIWFLIASLTGSAVIGVIRPFTDTWTTLQIWSAVFLLTPSGIALDTVPRLVRPQGWTSIAAGVRKAIPVGVLSATLITFGLAVAAADTPPSIVGSEALVVIGVLAIGVVLAFVAGIPLLAFCGIGLLYAGFSLLVQFAWLPVVQGLTPVEGPRMLAMHLAAALALIVATATVQVSRHVGRSATETALVDWLRAEAILPEAPTVGSKATS